MPGTVKCLVCAYLFNPHDNLRCRYCYHLHFTDEKTQAQRGQITRLRSHSLEMAESGTQTQLSFLLSLHLSSQHSIISPGDILGQRGEPGFLSVTRSLLTSTLSLSPLPLPPLPSFQWLVLMSIGNVKGSESPQFFLKK